MKPLRYALTLEGVTLEIERLRGEAGRDAAKLEALSRELTRELAESAPEDPFLARYARGVLENYCLLARYGLFPEVRRPDDDL